MLDGEISQKSSESVSLGWFLRHRMLGVTHRLDGLAHLVDHIAEGCAKLAEHVARCGARGTNASAGRANLSGDDVCELDEIADVLLMEQMDRTGSCAGVVSEERALPEVLSSPEAPFLVAVDPLDGSSNLGCSIPVGTIFSIRRRGQRPAGDPASFLDAGKDQVAAGYVIYGSPPELVLTVGQGVHVFFLDEERRWRLRQEDVRLPSLGRIYSVNEAHAAGWEPGLRAWLATCKERGYTQRYVGSMVADVHRTLLKGGIFLYPGDTGAPEGKLRLVYEAAPMAFLFESAGGYATSGTRRLIDVVPRSIHERTPVVLGGRAEVLGVQQALAANSDAMGRRRAAFRGEGNRLACAFELQGRRVRGHLELSGRGSTHQFLSERTPSSSGTG